MAKSIVKNRPERAILGHMSGPAPTSPAIKVLEGGTGHRPLRRVPVPQGTPVPPLWLRGQARKLWGHLVPELQRLQLVGKIDEPALVALCTTWQMLLAVDVELADPKKCDDPRLQRRASQLRALLLTYLQQFGATPASRARLAPPTPPSSDDMNGLLQ
jgi:P27 family predicted phage terminase small subunit